LIEGIDLSGARDAAGNLLENANIGERVGDLADNVDVGAIGEKAGDAAGGILERAGELLENVDLGGALEAV
jgi:hypothetical protein